MSTKIFRLWPIVFLFCQLVLYYILRQTPDLIEKYYSNFWFPKISLFLTKFFGKISFSVGDCLYYFLIFFIVRWFYLNRKNWRLEPIKLLLNMVGFFSVIYFLFHFLWGFNYYRIPLSEKMQLKTDYSDQDLIAFTNKLISKTNAVHFQITKDSSKKVLVNLNKTKLLSIGVNGYENLSKKHAFFEYKNTVAKASLFSKPLSYMGFGGYLNPFTLEAQVNDEMPKYSFLMTASHEMAHQIGFANESECNFIGFLAATSNDNLMAQYAGYSFALHYCLRILERKNPMFAKSLYPKINAGILRNFDESEAYWKAHESIIETGFKVFYDRFLKSNNQQDGLAAYGKFLNLLINYEKQTAGRIVKAVE